MEFICHHRRNFLNVGAAISFALAAACGFAQTAATSTAPSAAAQAPQPAPTSTAAQPASTGTAPQPAATETTDNTPAGAAGVGDLLVAPTRLILEGRTRTAELALVNIGSQPATFRISLMHMKMLEDGDLKEIEKPGPEEVFADSLIRYSPRQVILEPHVVQTVRVQLRLPENLGDGEYRTHLLFRGVPPPEAVTPVDPQQQTEGFRIRLTPIYGVSIPLIIRHGETKAAVTLSNLAMQPASGDQPAVLHVQINRNGNRSVYGNMTVRFTPKGGKEQVVGLANGIAVYTPLAYRAANLPLHPPAGVKLANGRVRVTYVDAEQPAGGDTLGEVDLAVP